MSKSSRDLQDNIGETATDEKTIGATRLTKIEKLRFAISYVKLRSAKRAYQEIRKTTTDGSAKTLGLRLLKTPEIQRYIELHQSKPNKIVFYLHEKSMLDILQTQVLNMNEDLDGDIEPKERALLTNSLINTSQEISRLIEKTSSFEAEEFDILTEPDD